MNVPAPLLALAAVLAVLVLRPPSLPPRAPGLVSRVPRWRPGAAAARRSAELEWLEAFVAELRAGGDPRAALVLSAVSLGGAVVPTAVVAARSGADVGAALIHDAEGSELLRGVSACWEVAEGSGAGLADALLTLADAARATERVRRELQAGLAEPRATALVLACLPLLGLLLGVLLGADPVSWLLGSAPGRVVLVAGAGLEVLGAWWAWRIAVRLEAEL
ncbi:MAG: type II secretion system F family protein [Candidatus Nanopelagicales bacterium]